MSQTNEQMTDADAIVAELERKLRVAREALEGTLALAIAWAAHYEFNQKLDGFHPTHARIIANARATLSALDAEPVSQPTP